MPRVPFKPLRACRVDAFWLLLAAAFLAYLFVDNARRASLRIDGVRYFWLDDDMTISMRYARNLAHGLGLVWNPGQRVEGYTNFGWTLVMAVVHLFPIPDAQTALYVRGIAFVCCVGALVLARDIVRLFDDRASSAAMPVMLACVVTCVDVVTWAVDGFETVLVTVVHLWVVSRLLERRTAGWTVLGALAVLPIIRSDGLHVWLGDALLIVAIARPNRRLLVLLAATLLPFAAHLLFRRAYYGAWFPNTYYLKVLGLDHKTVRGWSYVTHFVERYWLPILFATATAATLLLRKDRRALSLATTLAPPMLYALSVGGDNLMPSRFFAHTLPEVFLFASIGAGKLVSELAGRAAWLGALAGFSIPWHETVAQIAPVSTNGDPYDQIVVAAFLRKNALPDSSVAVIPAGMVPYFSRLRAEDLLGKTDPHVARLSYRPNAWIGHGKIDPDYSFGKKPDFFVSCRSLAYAASLPGSPPPSPDEAFDYVRTLLESPVFRSDYFSHPVPVTFLQQRSAVYVQRASAEGTRFDQWQGVVVGD